MEPTQCIKIGGNVLRYEEESRKPSQRIKIGNACIKIGMHVLRYALAFGNV